MSTRTVLTALLLVLASHARALSVELVDPAALGLEVREVQEVSMLPIFSEGEGFGTISAKEGAKVEVVTLAGSIESAGRLILTLGGMNAIFDEPGNTGTLATSTAVAFDPMVGMFISVEPGQYWNVHVEPGAFSLKVAFIIPDGADHFRIMFPVLLQDVATIPSEAEPEESPQDSGIRKLHERLDSNTGVGLDGPPQSGFRSAPRTGGSAK